MEPRSIRTDAGTLDLIPAGKADLAGIARYWSLGFLSHRDRAGHYGLIFQRGDEEACGVKLQFMELKEKDALIMQWLNRCVIAAALPRYLEKQHLGVMVPSIYYKKKGADSVETGFALFVGPDKASMSRDRERAFFDARLGEGATPMILDMVQAIIDASRDVPGPERVAIGLDLRPRRAMGSTALYFVVEGTRVFVVREPLEDDDPVWKYVVRAGFSRLSYVIVDSVSTPKWPAPIR